MHLFVNNNLTRLWTLSRFSFLSCNFRARSYSGVAPLSKTDPELHKILVLEKERQRTTLDLIASEVLQLFSLLHYTCANIKFRIYSRYEFLFIKCKFCFILFVLRSQFL